MGQRSWKDRLRKPHPQVPISGQNLLDLLQPQSSPYPIESPQPNSPRISKAHRDQTVVSDRRRKIKIPPQSTVVLQPVILPEVELEVQPITASFSIYYLGDAYLGRRFVVKSIGIDIGTKNIVLAFRGADENVYLREINGYYVYPNSSPFIKNMLNDPNKIRSDGTKRPARWVEYDGRPGIFVLGKDAEELAYAHNDTLQRPMAAGSISQDEDAMMVLASIVQGLFEMAESEMGEFDEKVSVCYCTTAPALNSETSNYDFHREVVDLIIKGYDTKSQLVPTAIKESHAIVLKESSDGTGIGISWGAGTVTVSYVLWGTEVYSFCWVGSGDWIDAEVAMRHGYDPAKPRNKSKETPTTVCRRKEQIDLSPNANHVDRLDLEISLHYKLLIDKVIVGIINGFIENESQARIDKPINVYMAGGTCSPPGFEALVSDLLAEHDLPFEIDSVVKSLNPLFTVAEGCLIAAELQ